MEIKNMETAKKQLEDEMRITNSNYLQILGEKEKVEEELEKLMGKLQATRNLLKEFPEELNWNQATTWIFSNNIPVLRVWLERLEAALK